MAEIGKKNLVTLTRFIQKNPNLSATQRDEFALLFSAIQLASKIVGNSMKRAGIEQQFGLAGTTNVHGEEVKKLDLIANDAFKEALVACEQVAVMASEEEEEAVIVDEENAGKYVLTFDPLDGSSNIDANVSVGSIFGVYSKKSPGKTGHVSDCLQAGRELVASGYSIYGSAIILVVSMGVGVNGFTYDPSLGEFVISHPDMKVPEKGSIYSVNEGNSVYWPKATYEYVQYCKSAGPDGKKPYSARYIGSMVADVHRTLLYGGIFMYPGDSRAPNGKLRYLYEVAPLSFIVEKAGGLSTTGTQRCLDIVPDKVHLRVPVFMGSKQQVLDVEEFFKKYPENK